ncbi:MAG: arylesterase [Gammaproteobacteria bacterium]|jgi:acyl-CoA thioesterase-1|nr:arylesterase [Gammaproteobacteria bacterium]MBU1407719.1 arylesterase [Gammaproteobacteria bacterium]MBU1531832.1 arylesterase [Gammaproteobacteria bacterium]
MNYRLCLLLLLWLPGWAQANACTLLIVGDSLSSGYGLAQGQGWVDLLDARMKKTAPPQKNNPWRVVNASITGDTTQNGLQRLAPALERHRPQGVLIELGGNDALRGTPPDVIRQNLLAMVRQAKAAGAWVALLDAPVLPNYGKAYADAVAKLYGEVARAEKSVLVPCFVCGVGVTAGMMQSDGIHPNEKAQPRMLDAVWPHIKPKLRCPVKKP